MAGRRPIQSTGRRVEIGLARPRLEWPVIKASLPNTEEEALRCLRPTRSASRSAPPRPVSIFKATGAEALS